MATPQPRQIPCGLPSRLAPRSTPMNCMLGLDHPIPVALWRAIGQVVLPAVWPRAERGALIRLDEARSRSRQALPQPGDFVEVRARHWLVEEVEDGAGQAPIVSLSCIDDDAQGDELRVIWEAELGARLVDDDPWSTLARDGADDAEVFAAFLRTLKWRTATAADRDLFQAPFRAGIRLDAYQLAPLSKGLKLPRVNLLIADDVGLGKTIEAALVVRELLLRRRIDFVLVAAPPSMTLQWQDELEAKFGLSFQIIDREQLVDLRRLRGFAVNPWSTGSRFIISHRLLTDETYVAGLRDLLGEFRARALSDSRRSAPRRPSQRGALCHRQSVHQGDPRHRPALRAPALLERDAAQRPFQQLLGDARDPRPAALHPRRAGAAGGARTGHGASAQSGSTRARRDLSRAHRRADRDRWLADRRPGTGPRPTSPGLRGSARTTDRTAADPAAGPGQAGVLGAAAAPAVVGGGVCQDPRGPPANPRWAGRRRRTGGACRRRRRPSFCPGRGRPGQRRAAVRGS